MSYALLENKKRELIRKAVRGSVFLGPMSADPIAELTIATGTAPNQVITMQPLPETWDDAGWLTGDGAQFAREVAQSDITSWGSNTPTRTDITADTTTLTITCQETKLLTLGLATGADLAGIKAKAGTGEVSISKPDAPRAKSYRALSVAVDEIDAGEIYIARFLPSAKVTNYSEQSFGSGDEAITWGVTLTGEKDSALGYTERWIFGGAGWLSLLEDMGIDQEV